MLWLPFMTAQFVPHRNFPWSSSAVLQMLRCRLRLLTGLRLAPSQTCFWPFAGSFSDLQSALVVEFERVNFAPPDSVYILCRVFCGISLGLHLVFSVQSQRFNESCKLDESRGLFTRITKSKKRRRRRRKRRGMHSTSQPKTTNTRRNIQITHAFIAQKVVFPS